MPLYLIKQIVYQAGNKRIKAAKQINVIYVIYMYIYRSVQELLVAMADVIIGAVAFRTSYCAPIAEPEACLAIAGQFVDLAAMGGLWACALTWQRLVVTMTFSCIDGSLHHI